jgi:hypothetical protein
VAVVGNVTVRPGTFPVGTTANSRCGSRTRPAAIAVVNVPTADSATIALGDRLEVTGPLALFSGQLQIAATRVRRPGHRHGGHAARAHRAPGDHAHGRRRGAASSA